MPIAPAPTMTIDSGRSRVRICSSYVTTLPPSCDARQQAHLRAGRDDRVVEGDALDEPSAFVDVDRVRVDERAAAVVLGDLVLLHQEVDALDVGVGDLAAAVPRDAEVEVHVTRDAEELGLVVEVWARSAFLRSALEGMQPTLRQTPPQYFSSMTATERPS